MGWETANESTFKQMNFLQSFQEVLHALLLLCNAVAHMGWYGGNHNQPAEVKACYRMSMPVV
jgi:hypothetical protein